VTGEDPYVADGILVNKLGIGYTTAGSPHGVEATGVPRAVAVRFDPDGLPSERNA
jgi:hypothetical protein